MAEHPHRHKARLTSQHEPHAANPHWPHWGRDALDHGHAIFAIAAHLRSMGMEHWLDRLTRWLSHYDGFERYVEEGHDPCVCVRDLLASHVTRLRHLFTSEPAQSSGGGPGRLLDTLVHDILQLDFIYYRVYWGRGLVHDRDARVWNPLRQPWMSFLDSGLPGQELISWRAQLPPQPSLAQHRAVLMGGA